MVRASLMNAARTVERPITWEDKVWLSWATDAGAGAGELIEPAAKHFVRRSRRRYTHAARTWIEQAAP